MNIAFILQEFPVTSQTFVYRQIDALIKAGHEVSVLAMRRPNLGSSSNTVEAEQLKVLYLPGSERCRLARFSNAAALIARSCLRHPARIPAYFSHLSFQNSRGRWDAKLLAIKVTLLNETQPFDVICCHFGENGAEALVWKNAGALFGKLVTVFHGYDVSSYLAAYPDAYKQLMAEGNLFLTVNEVWRSKLEALGFPPEKMCVHHMGVACSEVTFNPTPLTEPIKLVSVTRLVEKKGLVYAVRAVPEVIKHYPNLVYTIIGDGPLRAELEAEVARLGVQTHVKFLGPQPSSVVFEALSEAHILLAPSVTAADGDMEGIPVAMMEAMAQGTPVLSTWHSGIPELIDHGISGYLVPERDSDALASGLLELLAAPETLADLSRAARAKVEREFNNDALDKQLVELLSAL